MERRKSVLAWTALIGLMLSVTGWGLRAGAAQLLSSVHEAEASGR